MPKLHIISEIKVVLSKLFLAYVISYTKIKIAYKISFTLTFSIESSINVSIQEIDIYELEHTTDKRLLINLV